MVDISKDPGQILPTCFILFVSFVFGLGGALPRMIEPCLDICFAFHSYAISALAFGAQEISRYCLQYAVHRKDFVLIYDFDLDSYLTKPKIFLSPPLYLCFCFQCLTRSWTCTTEYRALAAQQLSRLTLYLTRKSTLCVPSIIVILVHRSRSWKGKTGLADHQNDETQVCQKTNARRPRLGTAKTGSRVDSVYAQGHSRDI